ncbi:hypothetical protein NECAME_16241 [Necator americanus]|uniref:Uncharacterized protein n=1 Tax=Necator americanus TaxID=51031 RepID=W2TX31_NECAM|nr:hypothetical protein NECAME_16241 [Necator americanus]ETN86640.1 hypothetical protein NECAME_16241 [Necator americanus]
MRDLLHIRLEISLSADDAIIKTRPVFTSRALAAPMIVIDVLARRVPIRAPQIRRDLRAARFSVGENGARSHTRSRGATAPVFEALVGETCEPA